MTNIIQHDGDIWRVLGTGRTREDGKTYVHLASTTRGRQQRNGWCPKQMEDWVDLRDPLTAYYQDHASSGNSPLEARP